MKWLFQAANRPHPNSHFHFSLGGCEFVNLVKADRRELLSSRLPGFQFTLAGEIDVFREGKAQTGKHCVCPFPVKRRFFFKRHPRRFVALLEPDCMDYPYLFQTGHKSRIAGYPGIIQVFLYSFHSSNTSEGL
jgi:hypothetical protein